MIFFFCFTFSEVERFDLIGAYYRRLTSDNEEVRMEAAKAWSVWEMTTSRLFVDRDMVQRATGDVWAQQLARIEWYFNLLILTFCLLLPIFLLGGQRRCMLQTPVCRLKAYQ